MFNLAPKKYTSKEKLVNVFYLSFAVLMMSSVVYWIVDGWGRTAVVDYVFFAACLIASIYIAALSIATLLGFTFDDPAG